RRRKVQERLDLGHEVDLTAALEHVHALLRRDHRIAVEVGRALLELGEVLDGLEGALRAEQALDVHAAQARGVDAMAERLRSNVSDEMRGAVAVTVDVAVEASDASARQLRASVVGLIELLLRKRSDEQAK